MRKEANDICVQVLNDKPDAIAIVYRAGESVRVAYHLVGPQEVSFLAKIFALEIDKLFKSMITSGEKPE